MKKWPIVIVVLGTIIYGLYLKFISYTNEVDHEVVDSITFVSSSVDKSDELKISSNKKVTHLGNKIEEILREAVDSYDYPLTCLQEAEDFQRYSHNELISLIKNEKIQVSTECLSGLKEVYKDEAFMKRCKRYIGLFL